MNRLALYLIAIVVGAALLLFTCTYQVRFNEVAIVTTFRRAGDDAVVTEPGLHFKWPYPIQSVERYDRRQRVLETRLENVMTKDNQLVVAQVFLTWSIDDPLTFFRVVTQEANAERRLDERLRSALGVFSEFNFHDLVTTDPAASKLPVVEERMQALLESPGDGSASVRESYGINPIAVGISRFILPEKTSEAVFERMKTERERLASDIESSGDAEAERIKAEAESAAKTIEAFANRRAQEIRAQGDREAAAYAAQMAEDERFAIFLQQLRSLEALITRDTTVILPNLPPFNLLAGMPSELPVPDAPTPAEEESGTIAGGRP